MMEYADNEKMVAVLAYQAYAQTWLKPNPYTAGIEPEPMSKNERFGKTLHDAGYRVRFTDSFLGGCPEPQVPDSALYSRYLPDGYTGTTQLWRIGYLVQKELQNA